MWWHPHASIQEHENANYPQLTEAGQCEAHEKKEKEEEFIFPNIILFYSFPFSYHIIPIYTFPFSYYLIPIYTFSVSYN